jgi:hypothetical protein
MRAIWIVISLYGALHVAEAANFTLGFVEQCRTAEKPSFTIKVVAKSPAPGDLAKPIRELMDGRSIQLIDPEGVVVAEVWLRKEVPVKATEVQFMNGLTYQEAPAGTILGAIRFPAEITDYRKQKLAEGVYTLRLAFQPMSDDHVGTAPHSDFCLLCPAAHDKKAVLVQGKDLLNLSKKSTGGDHPAVMLLFPGKGAKAEPKLERHAKGCQVLVVALPAASKDGKGRLPFGLTLVGASPKR